ncbi:MAG: DUF6065 family protein [Halothiobacillaceae bacterium]
MSATNPMDEIPLIAFSLLSPKEKPADFLRPAPLKRDWMEQTPDRFAYRCLPLNIANTIGWELLNPVGFEAIWSGGDDKDAIRITPDEAGHPRLAVSHFGSGILTFHIPLLFRTPPGIQIMATGPINAPKDGIAPLAGVVETDWLPFTFTMNWKFTRADQPVRFEAGEPIAAIIPLMVGLLEHMSPRILDMHEEPGLADRFRAWTKARNTFIARLAERDPEAVKEGWQRHYFQGTDLDGAKVRAEHRTKVSLRPFRDER